MNCPKHAEISAYMDETLTSSERRRFAVHLDRCPVCRQQLDELLVLRSALRDLPSPVLGFDLAANLEHRMRSASRPPPARSFWAAWGAPGLAVALSLASGAWLGALLIAPAAVAPPASVTRVFDPVPPGGLCAAAELCGISKGLK
ncbi:anti-sigma factor [Noviherbaspirillum sp. UKPF54]|uniref:anti-sigma factor family protein n=1 Tax=Noviherbaspirillum sp. UKPF54 TaxID=2601898 RepID=UPI0011B1A24F|nr:zf-HC2 domain-containing protein [Noviherbaspirillum sp. UKPF54]QDZ30328.1 zf-HC2 domain-containing protein [Noviherbaspirillum sp. UKPF54]